MSRRKRGNDNTAVGILVLAVLMVIAIALGWYGLQIEEAGKTTSTPTSSTQTTPTTSSTTSTPTNTTSQLFTVVNMTTTTSATNTSTS